MRSKDRKSLFSLLLVTYYFRIFAQIMITTPQCNFDFLEEYSSSVLTQGQCSPMAMKKCRWHDGDILTPCPHQSSYKYNGHRAAPQSCGGYAVPVPAVAARAAAGHREGHLQGPGRRDAGDRSPRAVLCCTVLYCTR